MLSAAVKMLFEFGQLHTEKKRRFDSTLPAALNQLKAQSKVELA